MGILNGLSQGIVGGDTSATGLAQRSLLAGTLGTELQASGVAANAAAQAGQMGYAAKLAGQASQSDLLAGQFQESAVKGKYSTLVADEKAAQAANGVNVNSGSAVAVRDATASMGLLDAATIHYNTLRAAFGEREQSSLLKRGAAMTSALAPLGVASTFLSGASSLSSKWLQYQRNIGSDF